MVSLLSNAQKAWQIQFALKKKGHTSQISLSHQTIARQIEETGKSIKRSLESKAANFKFYALAMDNSTDATDMAQLAIFIRGIDQMNIMSLKKQLLQCH